ncbi:MAG: hypothetical protein ACE5Q6_13115 [Dehalococcoidia bacterium]
MTNDHVPPRNIFPKPRPINLITVPACDSCNSSTSKDDEYFRMMLCMSEQEGDNASAHKNRETIIRSLKREHAVGLKTDFLSHTQKVQVKNPNGLFLSRTSYEVDLQRIFGTVAKTVKGLFYYETGRRLHEKYAVKVQNEDSLRDLPVELIHELFRGILIPLYRTPPNVIGNGDFSYRFHIAEKNPFWSAWHLTFYGRVNFIALTGDQEIDQQQWDYTPDS